MSGCIYRTKNGECKDPNRGKEYGPLCRSDCTNKHPSNADRIRAMTDEELAELLHKNRGGCRALTTESYVCDFYTEDLNTDCKACWLDWLKQEAE